MGLEFSTGNSAVARRVLVYLKKDFGLMPSTMVRQGRRLRKKNVYTLVVQPSAEGLAFLNTMGLSPLAGVEDMENLKTDEEKRAYLAGAFLGGGSVSRPQSDYHLEMVTQSQKFAGEIVKAMKAFRMNAKLTDRKNDYIVYIKDGDEVSGFLQIVGAAQSYMDFEGVRVVKDMRNRVNRQVNCETANLQKTVDAVTSGADSDGQGRGVFSSAEAPRSLRTAARSSECQPFRAGCHLRHHEVRPGTSFQEDGSDGCGAWRSRIIHLPLPDFYSIIVVRPSDGGARGIFDTY